MSLNNVLLKILKICEENYISDPYIVGGIPRDIYLNRENDFRDIDITTNDSDTARLAITTAYSLNKGFKVYPDSHVSIFLENKTLDFSSNFVSTDVIAFMEKDLGIEDPKLFEVFSRDFTINTLHKSFLDNNIIDPTNMGINDLNNKIIRTPVPAAITIQDDVRRLFRAINFAARLNFNIDEDIVQYALENRRSFTGENRWKLKDAFLTSLIGESIEADADITMHYISEMNLLPVIPMVGRFKDELIKRKLVGKYLDDAINMTDYELQNIEL